MREILDLDGDGFPDALSFDSTLSGVVARNAGGAFCASSDGVECDLLGGTYVAPRPGGFRSDLLVGVQNPLGSMSTLEYRPASDWNNDRLPFNVWTLTRIVTDDGLCELDPPNCLNGGTHTLEKTFEYEGGMFDTKEREFRGFESVIVHDVDPHDWGSFVGLSRSTEYEFLQDSKRKGKVLSITEYQVQNSSPGFVRRTANSWVCADLATGDEVACDDDERQWVRLKKSATMEFGGGFRFSSVYNHAWQNCSGRFFLSHTSSGGSDTLGDPTSPRLHTHTNYNCGTGAASNYQVRPRSVIFRGTGDTEPPLAQQAFFYDSPARGNLTAVETWLDSPDPFIASVDCSVNSELGGTGRCVRREFHHDAFGNVIESYDENGNPTMIEYDSIHIYPRVITSPLGHKITQEHDPSCGVLLSRTNVYEGVAAPPSAQHHRWVYDQFCRLTKEVLPGQSDSDPQWQGQYYLGVPVSTAI